MKSQIVAAVLAALPLAACMSMATVNPDGGIVENAASARGALKLAEAHCAKSNRTAKAVKYEAIMGTLNFECVSR